MRTLHIVAALCSLLVLTLARADAPPAALVTPQTDIELARQLTDCYWDYAALQRLSHTLELKEAQAQFGRAQYATGLASSALVGDTMAKELRDTHKEAGRKRLESATALGVESVLSYINSTSQKCAALLESNTPYLSGKIKALNQSTGAK